MAKGLKPPTKIGAKTSVSAKKTNGIEWVDASGPAVSHDDDPIGASLKARFAAGGLGS